MAASVTKKLISMSTLSSRSIIPIILLYYNTSLISANNLLHCNYYQNGDCICPEDVVVFDCSVSGGVATAWRGNIFNCPNRGNQIFLRHRNFENGTSRTCNNGEIVAYSSEITNNRYNSRLNVTVTPEMHNGTVECIKELKDLTSESVGTCALILATGTQKLTYIASICTYTYIFVLSLYFIQKNPQSLLGMFMFLTLIPTS